MKKEYRFIYQHGELTRETVIYHVPIGTSVQDQRDLAFLRQFSFQPDVYFALNSDEVSEFLRAIALSVWDGDKNAMLKMTTIRCSCRDLVKRIKSGAIFASNPVVMRENHEDRMSFDIGFRCNQLKLANCSRNKPKR